MKIVVIKEMSAGNESVGDMWKETKIFEPTDTLLDVVAWINDASAKYNLPLKRNAIITVADNQPHTVQKEG